MVEQIKIAQEWLKTQVITKSVNRNHTSYGYKHMAEKWAKMYISNEAMIEAVKLLKIPYNYSRKNKKNIFVALSERTLS